ncbi:MAG: ATP-binding protein [Bacteroidales bacterium]|nr:ATP-binding protein [Bacteroidales bacterium]MDD6852472.1 ATP-binding protein [Bacteroidales bacterium]
MERTVLQQLSEWKRRSDRKPLILNGARQVGKTWAIREFARREYAKEAYIICRKNDLVEEVFKKDFDIDRIIRSLRAISGVDISPADTLIILDEVQEIPEAIESLKYFCENAPEYHIAVAGSMLGISLHAGVSFPVGKVNVIDVYPMNFEEFLMALGENEAYKVLKSHDFETTNLLHEKYVDLLRQYYYVGGMPEAVKKYVETGALNEVRRIQNEILQGYELDFSKHAPREQVERIRMVWRSVPSQLFKDNKKFIYGALRTGARAKDFEMSLQWLQDAGLIYKVPRCTKPELPLDIYQDFSAFKIYILDTGLLGAMVKTTAEQVLINNGIFTEYKGGMTEQYVLQQLISQGAEPIYYYSADNSRLEIDFVIQYNGSLLPIEVKAGTNVRANSLSNMLRENEGLRAVRFSMLPFTRQGQLTCVPLYALM